MEKLIEILENKEKSYSPVVAFNNWRIAIMNDMEKYSPQNVECWQKHNLSDESFVLLKGKCTLFVADGRDAPYDNITACKMEPQKVYNIKKGVWHTHTFSEDTSVLIVENDDTNDTNSPKVKINGVQKDFIIKNSGF